MRQQPEHVEALSNLAVCRQRLGQHDEVARLSRQVLALRADHPLSLDLLSKSLFYLGRESEAAAAGTASLVAKDRACPATPARWQLPNVSPQDFAGRPGKRQVIAFSLWGAHPRYLRGALRNALLTPDLYPEWTLRFHVDDSVPADFLDALRSLHAEVAMQPAGQTLRQRLCWRFQVANDPTVGRFLVRDADSVFSLREVALVQAWCASDRWFHVIRDWWTHTDLMLAGLWGGVAGVLPKLSERLARYQHNQAETPNVDQWFLRDRVWSLVRPSCLVHDRMFSMPGSQRPPAPPPNGNFHIGQDEFAAHRRRQEDLLQAWIRQLPCLALPP